MRFLFLALTMSVLAQAGANKQNSSACDLEILTVESVAATLVAADLASREMQN